MTTPQVSGLGDYVQPGRVAGGAHGPPSTKAYVATEDSDGFPDLMHGFSNVGILRCGMRVSKMRKSFQHRTRVVPESCHSG